MTPLSVAVFVAAVAAVLPVAMAPAHGAAAAPTELTAVTPHRMLDTRVPGDANFGFKSAGATFAVQITGRGGIPAGVDAAVLNVTVTQPNGNGHITVWPCNAPRPTTSNLNYHPGQTVANMAIATLDATGRVCVFTYAGAHIVIDANGYLPAGADYTALVPQRLVDTRPGGKTVDGAGSGAGKQTTMAVQVTGRAGVPAGASAAAVNLTVTQPAAAGFLTVHTCGTTPPNASNVNFRAGETRANAAIVDLDSNGRFCVTLHAAAHVVVDISGWFGADGVTTVTPGRLADTRPAGRTVDGAAQANGRIAAGMSRRVQIAGRGGVPDDATAVVVNVTVVGPDRNGFATVYPCGAVPTASNVNYPVGGVVPNAVVAALDATGGICVFALAATDLVVDINGYIAPAGINPPISTDAPVADLSVGATCLSGRAGYSVFFTADWTPRVGNGISDVSAPAGYTARALSLEPTTLAVSSVGVAWASTEPWVSPASTTIIIKGVPYVINHGPIACTFY